MSTLARVSLLVALVLWAGHAHAQDRKAGSKPARERTAEKSKPPPAEADDDDETVHVEGETKVKEMEFSGLDIEGQLKTPQMLLFLNRLRAEFGRPRLPHRSFMPELQRSTRGKSF